MKPSRQSILLLLLLPALYAGAQAPLPRRIISVSPNITEILYGVGAFDRVVAVSDYCTYPPEVRNLPRVGGWQNSDLEKIASLRPDLVLLTDAQAPFIQDKLRQLELRSLTVPRASLQDVFTAIELIAGVTGKEQEGRELIRRTRAKLDEVRSRTKNLPRRSVLFVIDRTPGTLQDLYAATEGSFLVELIEIAGGRSIAEPAKIGYGRISKDAILIKNPEVIIDMVQGSIGKFGEHPELVWRDLPELRAVRQGRVYPVQNEYISHASQFVAETAQVLARMIHPEAFPGAERNK